MRCALVVISLLIAGCDCNGKQNNNPPDAAGDGGITETTCAALPPAKTGTCDVTAGGATKLIEGNVLTPDTIFVGGQVAVDGTGQITCVGCNCAQGGETTIVCPDAVI